MAPIVDIQVGRVQKLLKDRKIVLDLTDAAKRWLGRVGYDPVYGARPLKRAVQRTCRIRWPRSCWRGMPRWQHGEDRRGRRALPWMPKIIRLISASTRQFAVLHQHRIVAELLRQEEARARKHPGVRIAHQDDLARRAGFHGGGIGKQQVAPAQLAIRRAEGVLVLLQVAPLDELVLEVVFHRHEHAHDVAQEVRAGLGHRIEEQRARQAHMIEPQVLFVQRVGLQADAGHRVVLRLVVRRELHGGRRIRPADR
jgi:hypothetical protein